ncbi:cyclic nucleotide-binding domain-containing protein 1 isoform X3 [Canis lupus familiaris]|uniref:cyclic nucleotide-binding domain-containing protein 1 isoform X3 n=1 Tax=Canis lupus familiaris TaxID=9615 RepID=UPI0015F16C21|nr:cyclic nucleotide-binding domain-containing protein 1 isoform X3 [Canis lupus familiaris]
MSLSSLPAAILSHMIAINNVPPPPLRSLPRRCRREKNGIREKTRDTSRSLETSRSSYSILTAHNVFIKQYPKIFLQKTHRLPGLFKQEGKRKPTEDTVEEQQHDDQRDDSHNIAIHVKKARGGLTLYEPKRFEEEFVEFLDILKKLPIYRTLHEHKIVWKMLKTIPDLTCQLPDEHLKTLSKSVISETWVKGSTVVGNDGFYIILKGSARLQTKAYGNLIEEDESTASLIPQSFQGFVVSEGIKNFLLAEVQTHDPTLGQWSTFGTLEVAAQTESETKEYSVITEEDCEILKISAKNYARLKSEKIKLENKQKVKLIRKCPYYEEWPTLSIYELVALIKWKKFPPGHMIVESGKIISFVAYINSGYCNIYRNIVGLTKLEPKKAKKIKKLVCMGKLKEKESFGEISVLLQVPFTCTIITGKEVEMAIIEDKDLFELDPVTKQLMLHTAKPTFGHLTDEDVKSEYLQREQKKDWKNFKDTDREAQENLVFGSPLRLTLHCFVTTSGRTAGNVMQVLRESTSKLNSQKPEGTRFSFRHRSLFCSSSLSINSLGNCLNNNEPNLSLATVQFF